MDKDINITHQPTFQDVYIGRQPIYDNRLNIYAYELLFRSSDINQANVIDGDQATTEVILNAFTEIGLANLVGKHFAFINLTKSFIDGSYPLPDCKNNVVLEMLEDIEVNENIIASVKALSDQGYIIALDDFIFNEQLRPLIEIANIIKIDLMALTQQQLEEHVILLKQYPVKLLAEKVETQQEYEFCLELGFDYFQGYFFCKPKIIRSKRSSANKLAALRILAMIHKHDTSHTELEHLIIQDISMSMRLLRYINSSMFSTNKKIESIKHAIALLGLDTIRSLATLVVFSNMEDKPQELIVTALIRAKMCERIAALAFPDCKNIAFTTGLFSIIDAVMDKPMQEILTELPLSDDVVSALLQTGGDNAALLHYVIAYERGEWQQVNCSHASMDDFRNAYLEAVKWTQNISHSIKLS